MAVYVINPFKLEFTIVIFIHYKPRIAVTIILDLLWMKMIWCGLKIKENYHDLVNHELLNQLGLFWGM